MDTIKSGYILYSMSIMTVVIRLGQLLMDISPISHSIRSTIRRFRIVLFLAELNNLELWATEIGNAYLEAFTLENVYIVAGPEFKEHEGPILILNKAINELRRSGSRWHDRFSQCVSELGFFPCKSETDIWIRRNGDLYKYVAVYVDDLAIAMKKPRNLLIFWRMFINSKKRVQGLSYFTWVWISRVTTT
jgi:Reverse transcriptase (RNA-dependent DNA polymerase)